MRHVRDGPYQGLNCRVVSTTIIVLLSIMGFDSMSAKSDTMDPILTICRANTGRFLAPCVLRVPLVGELAV